MRSVFVYLRDTDLPTVGRVLEESGAAPNGPGWIWQHDSDPCLYINCIVGVPEECEPESRAAIRAALSGAEPTVTIVADVSGRHGGDLEVRSLLAALLRPFPGVAQDDYTDHAWTLAEVLSNHAVEGHRFFDYLGWHEPGRTDR